MKPRSKFRVHEVNDKFIFLIDEDDESVSMTNDAEAVCQWVHDHHPGWRIIYRDTEGNWDEMVHDESGRFTGFAPYFGPKPNPEP